MISHFETTPAALYMTKVKQDRDGNLQAQWIKNIDLSSIHGLWRPCAGSVTPWNTHLGSEEYPPDAKKIFIKSPVDPTFKLMALYVNDDIYDLNPYHYGWIPEIKIIDSDGDVKIKKHYAMGRFSHEVAYVMPDKKTLYLSDDIQNGVLFKFVADKKEDLSSGTLYAAKWIQTSSKPLQAEIKWISLGHSDDESIKEAIESGIEFGDLFVEAKRDSKNRCPKGFLPTNYNNQNECLQFKDGMKEIASRLESGRVAGMLQATTEFTKMEGITYNQNKNRLYIAISRVETSMRDNDPSDKGGSNDIRVPQNHCGMILSFKLNNFDITSATSLIAGIPNKNNNSCSLDAIAMPDNITFIPKADTLIIDEDSFAHQNNFIWAYNIKSKKLTKILSSPYGSETTSIYYYPNIKGFSYLMSVIQHPFGERDMEKIKFAGEKRAYLGYIGPFSIIE
jgi:secreted PhoX family phosphatase